MLVHHRHIPDPKAVWPNSKPLLDTVYPIPKLSFKNYSRIADILLTFVSFSIDKHNSINLNKWMLGNILMCVSVVTTVSYI